MTCPTCQTPLKPLSDLRAFCPGCGSMAKLSPEEFASLLPDDPVREMLQNLAAAQAERAQEEPFKRGPGRPRGSRDRQPRRRNLVDNVNEVPNGTPSAQVICLTPEILQAKRSAAAHRAAERYQARTESGKKGDNVTFTDSDGPGKSARPGECLGHRDLVFGEDNEP